MNVSFSRSDKCKTKINLIIDRDFGAVIGFTGDIAAEVFSQVRSAPAARRIVYRTSAQQNLFDHRAINWLALNNLVVRFDMSAMTINTYNILCKEIKAILANAGHPVLDIYGVSYKNDVYGFDYGFEIKVSEEFSIYTDFFFISKTTHNQPIYGIDSTGVSISTAKRQTCSFEKNNTCLLNVSKIPLLIKNLFPSVRYRNFNFLPDLSVLLNDLYTDLPENVVIFNEPGSSDMETVAKVLLLDSTDLSNALRNQGADIVAKAATKSSLQSLVNIGLVKVKQATALDSLGVIGLINSGGLKVVDSLVTYENIRYKVINGHPSTDDITSFLYASNKRVLGAGNVGVLNDSSLHYITDSIIAEQPRLDNQLHYIYDDASNILGALTCYSDIASMESITTMANQNLDYVSSSDNLITSSDLSEIAVTSLNMSSFLAQQEKLLAEYQAKSAAMNYTDIINNILYIDRQVAECFNAFTTLDSAAQVMTAKAAVYLKAIKQIMNFPLKTGYSALEFGKLAEALTVSKSGRCEIKSNFTPFFPRQYYKCCYGTFTINNGDPGRNEQNDIFVGRVYASLLNDVDGSAYLTKYKSKIYEVTGEQTHGSGKCRKVVVPSSYTEERLIENYGDFLNEACLIINALLSKPIMVNIRNVKDAISDVMNSCSKLADRRKPYVEKLIKFREYQEQSFMINHVINLIKSDFRYGSSLSMPKDCTTTSLTLKVESSGAQDDEESENRAKAIVRTHFSNDASVISRTNSLLKGVCVNDISIEVSDEDVVRFNDNLKTIKEKQKEIYALSVEKEESEDSAQDIALSEDLVTDETEHNEITEITSDEDLSGLTDVELKISIPTENIDTNDWYTTLYSLHHDTFRGSTLNQVLRKNVSKIQQLDEDCVKLYEDTLRIAATLKQKLKDKIKERSYSFNNKKLAIIQIDDLTDEEREKVETTIEAYKELQDVSEFMKNHESFGTDLLKIEDELLLCSWYGTNRTDPNGHTYDYMIIPVKYIKKSSPETEELIKIGKLSYGITTLLKHEHIFNFMPFSDMIMNKIKYALFRNTEVTDGEVYSKLQEKYGTQIAAYFSEYISKQPSCRNLIALLAYGCVASPKRCLASVLAFQGDQLGIFLKKVGLESYNVSCIENQIHKLLK